MEKKEVKKKTKKNQGLKKQIVRLADELSKIASVTRESLLSSDSDVEIVSDSEVECVVVDDDSDCEAHNTAGDLEFQAVQDNGPVVEPMEHGPSVDPLSIDCVIKTEPVVIKSEDSIYVTIGTTKPAPLPAVENEILPSEAKDKCVHTYSCDLCSYTSNYSTVMGVHKWRVHNIKGNSKLLYKCNLCNSSFRKAKSLRSHMKRPCSLKKSLDHKIEPSQTKEGDVNMFSCNLCSFTCEHSTVLGQHKWRVHKIKKISNPDLLNQSKNNILPSQTKKGNVGRFRCNLCSYTSNHKTVLGQHKWRVHEKNNIPISNLDCLKQPKSEILPSQTKKGGVGKFRCDLCPYTSNHKTVLGQHKWREHKINRISHPDLLKLSKSDILPPQIKKEDVGRFRCDLCSFTSNHNAVIGTHKRRVHNIKGNSKLNCNLCFFTTTNPKTLSYHKFHRHNVRVKKSHGVDLERSYNVRSSALKNETDVGDQNLEEKKGPEPIQKTQCSQKLGVPVFKRCQLCPFKTKVYKDLVLHKKKVHTVKLQPKISAGRRGHFKCTACHKSFTYQHNLLRHSNTSCRGLETSDITSRTIKHETSSGESELITEEKISCSFCGKQMKFQFQLRRHLEREHPDGWEKLKMETPLSNEEEQMQDVNKTDNRHEINESVTDNYYECNLCPFQTKSFRVIKIHRQLSHRKKKKADSHGNHVVKCWLCSEKLTFRSQLMRHYKTYHHNDWLEFVRSSQQSNIQLKGIERNGLDLENTPESSKDSSNISLKIGSTSRNSIESDKSWTDINPGELEQSVPARKFCQRCDRSYNSSYFIYHTCKKIIKCCFCNFVTRSSYMMHNHKTKLHRTQKVAKEGVESSEGTECKESQNPDVSRTSKTGVTLKKKISKRMASAGPSTEVANADQRTELASEDKKSVLEVSVEKELTCKALALKKRKPSKASRKKTSMITPRKTCSLCHKSYHAVYFRYHRCSKINKGNKIECALCKLHFQENSFQDHPCRPILKCKICPFTTRFKMTMRSHITNHVMDDSDLTEESLYKCKTCQKEFVSVSWFILHKRKGCQSTQMSVDHSQGIERVEEATCSSASRVSDFDEGADRS